MPSFTVQNIKRIYNDRIPNEYLEFTTDADTGELIEIRSCLLNELTQNYDIIQRVVIDPDSLDLVIQALESFRKPTSH